mgnify:CR=1 FL=1
MNTKQVVALVEKYLSENSSVSEFTLKLAYCKVDTPFQCVYNAIQFASFACQYTDAASDAARVEASKSIVEYYKLIKMGVYKNG